jgi:hypothetical protein
MKKKINLKEDSKIEHISAIPPNEDIEKQKRDRFERELELRKNQVPGEQEIITLAGEKKMAKNLNLEEQQVEIIRCTKDPIYFICTYLTIFDQTKGDGGAIVPFNLFPFQKELVMAYHNHRFNVANKYRQAGISTTTCGYIAWYVMFNEHRNVAIIADKLETARDEMMREVIEFIEKCPDWLRPEPIFRDTMKHKHYDNDCQLRAFSSKGLRGYTPTLLFWDETAWTERGDVFWTSARPTLQTGGRAIFVSTPNGLDPVFYKTFEEAIRGKNNFNPIELWWYNDPRYTSYKREYTYDPSKGEYSVEFGFDPHKKDGDFDLEWIKNKGKEKEIRVKDENWDHKKRKQMVEDGWEATSTWFEYQVRDYNGNMKKLAQELLCSFLGSGDNFIAEEYLKRIEESEIQTPIRQEYTDREMWIWEDPLPSEEYVLTIDASAGHGDDFSTVNVYKISEFTEEKVVKSHGRTKKKKITRHKLVQVAEYYNKLRPSTVGELSFIYGKKYNNAYIICDITGSIGVQCIEKLFELGYENIHYSEITHKPTRDMLSGYIKIGTKVLPDGSVSQIDLVPGFLIGQNRGSVLTELQRAIHLAEINIKSIRLLNELKTFVTVPGSRVADHKRSFHDDSIIPTACAIYVVNYQMTNAQSQKSKTKKMLDAMIKLEGEEIVVKNKNREDQNKDTKNPDYRVTKRSPYGSNSWLFAGLKK